MNIHRQILYSGQVQGVGFRHSVRQLAASYAVAGWVRNLADGRVEVLAGGEAAEVDAFLTAIAESHLGGHIREREASDLPEPAERLVDFRVRF